MNYSEWKIIVRILLGIIIIFGVLIKQRQDSADDDHDWPQWKPQIVTLVVGGGGGHRACSAACALACIPRLPGDSFAGLLASSSLDPIRRLEVAANIIIKWLLFLST